MSSKRVTVSKWAIHLMQYFDYFKSRSVIGPGPIKSQSVIGTLVATKKGQRLVAFFKDEFDLDMNSDKSISTTQYGTTIDAVFM